MKLTDYFYSNNLSDMNDLAEGIEFAICYVQEHIYEQINIAPFIDFALIHVENNSHDSTKINKSFYMLSHEIDKKRVLHETTALTVEDVISEIIAYYKPNSISDYRATLIQEYSHMHDLLDMHVVLLFDCEYMQLPAFTRLVLYKILEHCIQIAEDGSVYIDNHRIIPDTIYLLSFNAYIENEKLYKKMLPDFVKMEFTKIYEDTIDMVNLISAQIYEGEICAGKIMFIKDPQEFEGLCFKDYISVHDIRRTRKLLELSTEHHLIVNEHNVLGIGTTGDGNGAEFIIQGHLEWIYKNNGLELVKYKNGRYYVPTVSYKGFLNNYNISKISECFGADKARPIIEIIKSALDHEHGTILIITNDAYNEAKRLCASNRGLQCKKLNLAEETNKNFINEIIRIDGAVIIDENCFCHGIGIILDGEVVIKGSTARGARYNSAINYIAWKKRLGIEREYIAVIMSEDQTVDIITSQDQFQYIKELSTTAI